MNETESKKSLLNIISEIQAISLLEKSLEYYERLNNDRKNNKIKVIIVGHTL